MYGGAGLGADTRTGREADVQVVEGADTEGSPTSTITAAPVGVDAAGFLVSSILRSHGTTIKQCNDCSLNEHLVEVNNHICVNSYRLAKNGAHQRAYCGASGALLVIGFLVLDGV